LLVAESEEADDVRVADALERVQLLAEHTVEALAAAVDLYSGERAGDAREVHGAEPALADDGGGEPARHRLHLRPRQAPRTGLGPLLDLLIEHAEIPVVVALKVAGRRIGAAPTEEEPVPLHPHLRQESLLLAHEKEMAAGGERRGERRRRLVRP
jgi:hypothetical protein